VHLVAADRQAGPRGPRSGRHWAAARLVAPTPRPGAHQLEL